ncbi:MAG TPA: hypothetical protein PLN52_07080 [Opitutaceae bacterium]|nr:hypothetical protein [Opitutaceae bacterium]
MRLLAFLTAVVALTLTNAGCSKSSPVELPSSRGAPYRLLGILDPDRDRMVAFALKVPSDWRAQQEFHRRWDGAVGVPQVSITLNSPDGRSQIVYFPSTHYNYSEGPLSDNLRAQKRSMGMPLQSSLNELPPMPPVAYIKNILLPTLQRSGVTLSALGNELTAPEISRDEGQVESRGSVDATLANGNRARIECRIVYASRQIQTDRYHTWSVVPSITQTSDELEAVHAHTRVAQDSIVRNPTWMKLEQEAQARGYQANQEASRRQHQATMSQIQANTEAMTRGHNQRMAAIRQFGETNTARFNQRMTDMDREQRIRVDTIRGESQYVNPTTGERTKVADGYDHVYTSQNHPEFFLGTNTPIKPGELNWEELQKVQLKDY